MYEEIITDDFLQTLSLKENHNDSPLMMYSQNLELFLPKIKQFRRMWQALPEHIKKDKDLCKSLHSTKRGQFQGAVAELISAYILNKYFNNIQKDIAVGKWTPDFFAEKDEYKLLFETFSLGKDHAEIKTDSAMRLLRRELQGVKSKKGIFLVGGVYPNESGNFDGMGLALEDFLSEFDLGDDGDHELKVNGARISFSVFDKGEAGGVLCGWSKGVSSGDSHAEKLLQSILKKKEKYSFPHIEICVIDSTTRLSHNSIIKTLIGDQQIYIDRKTAQQSGSGYTNDGFWGIRNPNIDKNLHVQAFVFVWQNHIDTNEFQLKVCFAQNHHLSVVPKLSNVLCDIPDIFSEGYDGEKFIIKP